MVSGVSDIWISPSKIGAKGSGVDSFIMPAYHEKVIATPIPSVFATDVILEFISTNTKSEEPTPGQQESHKADIVTISREEIDAKFGRNKAEVDSVAASMRQEMAEFRTYYMQQFGSIDKSLSEIKGEISQINSEIGGVKTSLSTTQAAIAIGLTLVTVLLSGVMLASSWIISSKETPQAPQQAPIIIQMPAQQAQPGQSSAK
ncbi:TPA: hypothetical protein ACT24T_003829 [Yersinia enterocolitica]